MVVNINHKNEEHKQISVATHTHQELANYCVYLVRIVVSVNFKSIY